MRNHLVKMLATLQYGIFYLLMISTVDVEGTNDCTTPRNTPGKCVFYQECPIVVNIIQSTPLSSELKAHLQKYHCGFNGKTPKVCCETDAGPCRTTDQSPGVCVSITRCPSLLTLLEHKPFLSDKTVATLRQSECKLGPSARVCCPVINKQNSALIQREKLPQPGECGVQGIEDKLLGGTLAGISEFPWMALMEYGPYNKPILGCGGSLISEWFVLTAAHCVFGPDVTRYGNLQRIRLGEYDINNTTDCVNFLGNNDCSEPLQRIDVDKIISHEGFSFRNRDRSHDIALVKMKRAAKFSDFIRPICLPPPYLKLPNNVYVAGWGQTETSLQSSTKLKLQLPIYDHTKCRNMYATLRFPVNLGVGQICAGGVEGKDSCTGDSGGPLMAAETNSKFGNVWYQVGVVSFGPTPCGQKQPGVYSSILHYLPWIHKTVTGGN